jgi:methylthioribose-1-phosphate isomerase
MIPDPPTTPSGAIPTVAWESGSPSGLPGTLVLLDQTRLPHESVALRCADLETVRDAIRRLVVRGAPAIGVAAAYGLVVATQDAAGPEFAARLRAAADRLRSARPTAVNLAWAIERCAAGAGDPAALLAQARAIHAEDEAACAAMGRNALPLVSAGGTYLTHCNTGRLATAGIGTAFGVFVTAHAAGLDPLVYAGEVRPLLQGSRLTAFELRERGIRGALLPDSAAGALLATGRIDGVFVGADRIARNGDAANKIGTYGLAQLARAHGVAFHVVAPTSTIDRSLSDGSLIEIEQRAASEVLSFGSVAAAPAEFPVWNPAFDVTPAHLISAIVTERGIFRAPYRF